MKQHIIRTAIARQVADRLVPSVFTPAARGPSLLACDADWSRGHAEHTCGALIVVTIA